MFSQLVLSQLIIAQIVFYTSLAIIALIYVGYPILVFIASRLFPWPVRQVDITPSVSVIIAAYNEENDLAAKIENTLSLDYPKDKLEIVVASDCSTDRTDEIVRSFAKRGVILHRQPFRHGKTIAQNRAVKVSSGDILIFSDATTVYEKEAIREIVRSFADPEVGCVAGQLVYVNRAHSGVGKGCKSYWGYEKFIKACESRIGSLIGVSGCLYAVRRSCHARLAGDMIDDLVIATEIHLQGLRTVYEPNAISVEDTNLRSRDEFRMRVRVIEQTMNAIDRYRVVLNPFRHGMFAFQMVCHKLLRYTISLWLLPLFVSNAVLAQRSDAFRYLFYGQIIFYLTVLMGFFSERLKLKIGPLAVPYYFILINAAAVRAFLKFMRGEKHVVWEPMREKRDESPANSRMAHSRNLARR